MCRVYELFLSLTRVGYAILGRLRGYICRIIFCDFAFVFGTEVLCVGDILSRVGNYVVCCNFSTLAV